MTDSRPVPVYMNPSKVDMSVEEIRALAKPVTLELSLDQAAMLSAALVSLATRVSDRAMATHFQEVGAEIDRQVIEWAQRYDS